MTSSPLPPADDSDDANQLIRGQVRHNQISARIPESVSRGVFSTGAIVLMGNTEFILDFVLRMQRPHQVVQRVVLPHAVLPQLISTLEKNLEKYQERFGVLPVMPKPVEEQSKSDSTPKTNQTTGFPTSQSDPKVEDQHPPGSSAPGSPDPETPNPGTPNPGTPNSLGTSGALGVTENSDTHPETAENQGETSGGGGGQTPVKPRIVDHPSIEDIYDDLKMPEDGLIAAYANAVMISHSAAEFNLDFICNFFPRSVVSSRVFISAPQVVRMLDAIKNTYDDFQKRIIANRKQQINQLREQHEMPDYDPKNPYYKPPQTDGSEDEDDRDPNPA